MDMLKHRNLMSHTYDFQKFKEAVTAIHTRYLAALGQVYTLLKKNCSRHELRTFRNGADRDPAVQEVVVLDRVRWTGRYHLLMWTWFCAANCLCSEPKMRPWNWTTFSSLCISTCKP